MTVNGKLFRLVHGDPTFLPTPACTQAAYVFLHGKYQIIVLERNWNKMGKAEASHMDVGAPK